MAAAGDRRDPRMLAQADHQSHWLGHNTNRAVDNKNHLTSGWEKECRKLRDMDIEEEELKIYHCTMRSPIDNVDNLNNVIVNKVNAIASSRRSFFYLSLRRASKKELNKLKKSMIDLKRDILEAQREIRDAGGVFEKIPDLFNRPVRV